MIQGGSITLATVRSFLRRVFGQSAASRLGTGLMLVGFVLVAYSAGAFAGLLPGGYPTMPDPVALSGAQRLARLEATPVSTAATVTPPAAVAAAATPTAPPTTTPPPATAEPRPTPTPGVVKGDPSDVGDRREAALAPRPGAPLRLEIPSIEVETDVKVGGVVVDRNGELEWETLPFVAVTYPQLGPVGGPGNPVIAGHVVTLYEGNVFRNLYQVKLGDEVQVFTADSRFTYRVDEVKLVEPSDVSVMQPTEDSRLTLITCGGTFNPRTRTFSDRLIVIGHLAGGERLPPAAS